MPTVLSLLGIHPENSNLELIEPRLYKIAIFLGASNTSKTNIVYGKTEDMVIRYALACSYWSPIPTPIRKMPDTQTRPALPCVISRSAREGGSPAVTPKQIAHMLKIYMNEFYARLQRADTSIPVLLVADEIPNIVCNEELAPLIRTLAQTCGSPALCVILMAFRRLTLTASHY